LLILLSWSVSLLVTVFLPAKHSYKFS
jgi:hypothetical protein